MPVAWSTPSVPSAPSFASIDGTIVGYVTETAEPGLWLAKVLPKGPAEQGHHCYAGSEARGRSFVERWLKYHAPDTSGWTRRKRMPHEGPR
jgi:hypothetical protein